MSSFIFLMLRIPPRSTLLPFTTLFRSKGRGHLAQAPGASLASGADLCRDRSEEHTSELQSPYGISYAVFCLKQKVNYAHAADPALLVFPRHRTPLHSWS